MNVDTVRGIIMEMNNRSFDEIIGEYSVTWVRAEIVDTAISYPLVTEWCKDENSISVLDSLIDDINRSDTTLRASRQSMEVCVTKGVKYGIIKDER